MPITDEYLDYHEMQQLALDHECGKCHQGLSVAWGGKGYILRCSDLSHNVIVKRDNIPEYLRRAVYQGAPYVTYDGRMRKAQENRETERHPDPAC